MKRDAYKISLSRKENKKNRRRTRSRERQAAKKGIEALKRSAPQLYKEL